MIILHFADVHLGMMNYGGLDTSSGIHTRVLEYLDAMDQICDYVEQNRVDLILFAGDAFKNRTPNPTLVTMWAQRLKRLADVAPVLMVTGNHDMQRGGKQHSISIMDMLKSAQPIVVSDSVKAHTLGGAYVVTLPWMVIDNNVQRRVVERIYDLLDCAPDGLPRILVGHCTAELAETPYHIFNDRETTWPLELFCSDDWDYVALGHIHKYQALGDDPPVVYAGSIQRVDWGERDYDHGFVMVEVSEGLPTHWEFVKLDIRSMVHIEADYFAVFDVLHNHLSVLVNSIARVYIKDVPTHRSVASVHSQVAEFMDEIDDCIVDCIVPVHVSITRSRREVLLDPTKYDERTLFFAYLRKTYAPDMSDKLHRAALRIMGKELEG